MHVPNNSHLSYCTNIHPGQTWEAVFDSLKEHVPPLKAALSPSGPFGIGLRLSRQASQELGLGAELDRFRRWLDQNDCYVFTMNGFPYGGFHGKRVKDTVHRPDWTTRERVDYTLMLFRQLEALLPEGVDGSISTSPLSYKPWYEGQPGKLEAALLQSTNHLLEVIQFLEEIHRRSGKYLHLAIEPEPDGLLENTEEVLAYYDAWLLPMGKTALGARLNPDQIEGLLKRFLTICYDVCHYAVEYEEPARAIRQMQDAGIKIGKVQISAALQAQLPAEPKAREQVGKALAPFNESTYLHQVIERNEQGALRQFPDLPEALQSLNETGNREWRCHFHVPLFVKEYGLLRSTQAEIEKVLKMQRIGPISHHLEVETYTWEVLPDELRLELTDSIRRELEWVKQRL